MVGVKWICYTEDMFLVRQITPDDLNSVYELAAYIDSFNLPHDKKRLEAQINQSVKSFQEPSIPKDQALYIFVLEDLIQKKIIGSSLIYAKKGTPEAPNTYMSVLETTHKDESIGAEIKHQLLRFEFYTDGPSEIGGLVLHPDFRGLPIGLGKHLSFSRFLYIHQNPKRFESELLVEMQPTFDAEGNSPLWEAFGKRFTGLEYKVADRLSPNNKDFITNLFPNEDIYTCLFSKEAQEAIGKPSEGALPVLHMLEKVGFRYLNAVDPFDGGPHYGAKTAEVTLIKKTKIVSLSDQELKQQGSRGLLAFQGKRGFGCLQVFLKEEEKQVLISKEAKNILESEKADNSQLRMISPI